MNINDKRKQDYSVDIYGFNGNAYDVAVELLGDDWLPNDMSPHCDVRLAEAVVDYKRALKSTSGARLEQLHYTQCALKALLEDPDADWNQCY